jgi:hypothetical protein
MEATVYRRPLRSAVLDALDRPAREAILLQSRPAWVTGGIALAGAVLIVLASLCSLALDGLHFGEKILPRADLLRSLFEAILMVVPSAILVSAYFRIALSPRVVLASVALGLLIAGVVVASTLPLMAYLTLFTRAQPLVAPGAILPILALAASASTSGRVIRSIDPTPRARNFVIVFQALLGLAFLARATGV